MAKVEWDYIVPVKMPAALKSVEPGKLLALHFLMRQAF